MDSAKLRSLFIEFFKSKGHKAIASSPLLPADDPTLLFTNAGMNQFKDFFLGARKAENPRAVTSQKCIRAGGKHNDLENVGFTFRHLTFFEMLGNFSFGDYFKKEAIDWAFEFSIKVLKLDISRLWVTIHPSDEEAYNLWLAHMPKERIVRMEENFWMMGPTGPCGPCSELYYDRGEEYGTGANPIEDTAGDRVIEFWNLVFMQFEQKEDGSRISLPKPSIDTGMGLERVLMLKGEKPSVFETDVLVALGDKMAKIAGITPNEDNRGALRVISDHIRTLTFGIADGITPGPIDRGYVLRKILRRAVRFGRKLGLERPFLADLLPTLVAKMGHDYPEIVESEERIAKILTSEEELFGRTLSRGGRLMQEVVTRAKTEGHGVISGADAFKLYDTYGFPQDETLLFAKDQGLTVDIEAFDTLQAQARERSRKARGDIGQSVAATLFEEHLQKHPETLFVGDRHLTGEGSILAILKDGAFAEMARAGESLSLILDRSYFYAEKGGQVGDKGVCEHQGARFVVEKTSSPYTGVTLLEGKLLSGTLLLGEPLVQHVDGALRRKIRRNHTATHLLHKALELRLGSHIKQAGSLVDPTRLRFDFTHHQKLSDEDLAWIEATVTEWIEEDLSVKTDELSLADVSQDRSIKQFFGDKYGERVRLVEIDGCSKELCGGTHVLHTGEIGLFVILSEGSIASGVRRIEAITGHEARRYLAERKTMVDTFAEKLSCKAEKAVDKLSELMLSMKEMAQKESRLRASELGALADRLSKETKSRARFSFLASAVDLRDPKELGELAALLSQKLPSPSFLLLIGVKDEKLHLLCKSQGEAPAADSLLKELLAPFGGKGGGKKEMAQGQLPNEAGLSEKILHLATTLC